MSQRELRSKALILTTVGGVNERDRDTELPGEQYSSLSGVFPEFAGLQSRIWGKRLHQKFDGAVYGIFQFWTPLGYGVGLYQFSNLVDNGYVDRGFWLPPLSNFDFSLNLDYGYGYTPFVGVGGAGGLGRGSFSKLPFDAGYLTLDDFGGAYGFNFGYGDLNACTLSFLNGGTNHAICNSLMNEIGGATASNLPNDNSNSPTEHGRECRYELQAEEISYGVSDFEIGVAGENTNGLEGAFPYPKPLTVSASKPENFISGQGTYGGALVAYHFAESRKVGIIGGFAWNEDWSSYDQKAVLDLSAAISAQEEIPVFVTITFAKNANAPFEYFEAILQGLNFGEFANYQEYPFDPYDYLDLTSAPALNGNGGYTKTDFIDGEIIKAYYSRKVCS